MRPNSNESERDKNWDLIRALFIQNISKEQSIKCLRERSGAWKRDVYLLLTCHHMNSDTDKRQNGMFRGPCDVMMCSQQTESTVESNSRNFIVYQSVINNFYCSSKMD